MASKIIAVAVVSLVVVVLVAGVIIPVTNPDTARDTSWYYDDYKPSDSVSSVTGSLEIVTIGGKDYVHANDIGSGTIVYDNGDTETVNVKKANLDVLYLYGQSNAAGRNYDASEVVDFPDLGSTYYFGYADAYGPPKSLNDTGFDVNECSMYSLYDSSGDLRVAGLLPSLAYYYEHLTGHKVYLIDGAIGGKSITKFQPPSGSLWTYGDSILTAGLAEIDTEHYDYSCKYYIWIQGESDTNMAVNTYKQDFLNMHDAMMAGDMAGVHFDKCFISKVRAVNGVNSSKAQIQLTEEYPSIVMATELADTFTMANGLMGSDDLHYSQLGNNLLGKAIAESIAEDVNPGATLMDKYSDLLSAIPIMIFVALLVGVAIIAFRSHQ